MDAREFVELIRDYIRVVEHADWSRPHSMLDECARLLPRIYAAGLELPDVEPTDDYIASRCDRPTFNFGRFDGYWEIFDPYAREEPVAGSLADDLGDIYSDLSGPLIDFDAGRTADAIWQWKFNVEVTAETTSSMPCERFIGRSTTTWATTTTRRPSTASDPFGYAFAMGADRGRC